jgi:hypothetical protein
MLSPASRTGRSYRGRGQTAGAGAKGHYAAPLLIVRIDGSDIMANVGTRQSARIAAGLSTVLSGVQMPSRSFGDAWRRKVIEGAIGRKCRGVLRDWRRRELPGAALRV